MTVTHDETSAILAYVSGCGMHLCCMMPADETHDDQDQSSVYSLQPTSAAQLALRLERNSASTIQSVMFEFELCAHASIVRP